MEEVDTDLKSISVHEGYRRARRNTLVWSSLTILASVGTANVRSDADTSSTILQVTLPWIGNGLSFDQWHLVSACLVVSIFMLLGYLRARGVVDRGNSQKTFAKNSENLADTFGVIRDDAEVSAKTLSETRKLIETANKKSRSLERNLIETIEVTPKNSYDFVDKIEKAHGNALEEAASSNFQAATNAIDHLRQVGEGAALAAHSEIVEKIRTTITKFQHTSGESAENLLGMERQLVVKLAEVTSTADNLRFYHDSIAQSERLWDLLHDRVAVFVLFGLGFNLATHFLLNVV